MVMVFPTTPDVDQEFIARSLSGAIVGLVAVPGIAYVNNEFAVIRGLRNQQVQTLIEAELAQFENSEFHKQNSSKLTTQVNLEFAKRINETLAFVDSSKLDHEEIDVALKGINTVSRTQLEIIRSEIAKTAGEKYPELKISKLFRSAFAVRHLHVALITAVSLVAVLNFVWSSSISSQVPVRLFVIAACAVIALKSGNYWLARFHTPAWKVHLASFVTASFSPFVLDSLIFGDGLRQSLIAMILYFIWISLVGICAAFVNTYQIHKHLIMQDLVADLDSSLIRKQSLQELNRRHLKEIADFIHGRVQSRLMASSVNIASAVQENNDEKIRDEFQKLNNFATSPLESLFFQEFDFEFAFSQLLQTWSGLIEVVLETPIPKRLQTLHFYKIFEECLLNSFRHGKATNIWFSCSHRKEVWQVNFRDDGVGPRNGLPGSGTSIFNAYSHNWALTAGPEGIGSSLLFEFLKL